MSASKRTDRPRPCPILKARVRMPLWIARRLSTRLTRTDCIKGRVGRSLLRERDKAHGSG